MASLLNRLLGRSDSPIVSEPAVEAKGQTGPGWVSMASYPLLSEIARAPQKMMAEAQALFHNQVWVADAERAIVGRFVRAAWHLEQADGDTVGDDASPAERAVLDLLNRPNPRMTRRQLWSITLRHMGLAGNGFWYLDQRDLLNGTPLACLYINPVRMSPVEDQNGYLLGWVMDKADNPLTRRGAVAVPFELDELLHFTLDEPDSGHWGIGIAESAYSKLLLEKLADSHTAQMLASGGRIAGLLAPKQGASTMTDDQWQATVRDYRNIVGDPESAKRLHIVRGPVDFTETAAKPADMQLAELIELSRENIFAAWGVPLSQVGIMQTSGLNSGEHVKYEEAALWQGAIELRASAFEEKVQSLLDLFGMGLKLVVDTPTFDDQRPLFENADKAKVVPLTVNQRLEMVGRDPLDPELYGDLGGAIFIDQTMVRIDSVVLPSTEEAAPKAALDGFAAIGDRIRRSTEPRLREAVAALLVKQRDSIARLVSRHYQQVALKPNDHTAWWRGWDSAWAEQVEPVIDKLARRTVADIERGLARSKADSAFIEQVRSYLSARLLERVRDIDTVTRQEVAGIITTGLSEGVSPAELAQRIRQSTTFDDARAERIARTETAYAQNAAALRTYGDFGVAQVQAIDGDEDAECAARNGQVFSLSEAEGITDHPNGTLDWVPITEPVEAKASLPEVSMGIPQITIPMTVNVPEQAAPVVYVTSPEVNVRVPAQAAPVVNVTPEVTVNVPEQAAPVVNLLAPEKATGPSEVIVTAMPDRAHKLVRRKGEVVGSVESDA